MKVSKSFDCSSSRRSELWSVNSPEAYAALAADIALLPVGTTIGVSSKRIRFPEMDGDIDTFGLVVFIAIDVV